MKITKIIGIIILLFFVNISFAQNYNPQNPTKEEQTQKNKTKKEQSAKDKTKQKKIKKVPNTKKKLAKKRGMIQKKKLKTVNRRANILRKRRKK